VANFLGIEQWQNLVIGNCVTNSLFIFYQPNEKKNSPHTFQVWLVKECMQLMSKCSEYSHITNNNHMHEATHV